MRSPGRVQLPVAAGCSAVDAVLRVSIAIGGAPGLIRPPKVPGMPRSAARVARMLLVSVLLAAGRPLAAQSPAVNLYRESMSFCCKPADGYHDLDLFRDSTNNLIGNACIPGIGVDELRRLGIADVEERLERLRAGNVIAVRDGRCTLTFPVITGRRRDDLAAAVRPVARALAPRVAAMRDEIAKAVPGHEEMVFHLLWSRVVDQMWCRAWRREHRTGDCPPGVDWVLYPASPFTFGTNSWGNDFAVTWNVQTACAVTPVVTAARTALLRAAAGGRYEGPEADSLRRFGLLDADGRFVGFAYRDGGPLDRLLDRLTNEYAALVVGRYDYEGLAASLGIPVAPLWVILFHETAYAVFADLDRGGELHVPAVLAGGGAPTDCRATVSFLLRR
jgi:hypothetical protein